MISVKLENICKSYHEKEVLKNINYEFQKGLYILCGENGIGKSTIIKIIKGFVKPTKGEAIINGKICYIPDKVVFPSYLTIDNILKSLKDYYKSKIEISELYKLFNYTAYKDYRIKHISKGTYQKLLLSISLLNLSDIYLFDEPLNGLDHETCLVFKNFLQTIINDNKIIIISSHLPDFYLDLNPTIIHIESGILKC